MEENSATVRRYSHRVLGRRRCWQEGVAHRSIIGSGGSQRPTYPRSFRHAIHSADQNGMAWRVPSICVATVPVAVVGSMGSMRAGAARRRPATVHANHFAGGGRPDEKLKQMIDTIDAFYDGGRKACLLGRLTASTNRDQP